MLKLISTIFLISFSFIFKTSLSQNKNIDSLNLELSKSKIDTISSVILNDLAWEFINVSQFQLAESYALKAEFIILKAIRKRSSTRLKLQLCRSYNYIGMANCDQGNYAKSIKYHLKSIGIKHEVNDFNGIAAAYNNIGLVYQDQGDFTSALSYFYKALPINEKSQRLEWLGNNYANIGGSYYFLKNYNTSLKYHELSLKIRIEAKDLYGVAASYCNIGSLHYIMFKYEDAIFYFGKAKHLADSLGDVNTIAACYSNLGLVYIEQKKFDRALDCENHSLKIHNNTKDKSGIVENLFNLGDIYLKLKNIKRAEKYITQSLILAKQIGFKLMIREGYRELSEINELIGNNAQAYSFYKLHIIYRDSLINEEATKKNVKIQMQYEFEKKELAQKSEQAKKDANANAEKQKQLLVLLFVIGGLILVSFFFVMLFKKFKLTQKQKLIIEKQKSEVDNAYQLLHHKNKEIMDSIHYASKIQRAIITNENYFEKNLDRLTLN